ncbi:MAG: hypothetical protein MUF59_01115 [Candidatus Krumholzibacteria bacterium]|jgi:O-acetyl-ADP-ribose deacetylase (regulator of RNase III)|nr:hypothetical protein [Candidatus Krumholzibacteria bacterium]
MFWEADNERDKRKQRFIELMKRKKCMELLGPLSDRLLALDQGEGTVEEAVKAAAHAGKKGESLIVDFKKRPDVILAGIAMDENRHLTSIGEIGISARKAAVTAVFSDAIVCPVSAGGEMPATLASLISGEGGPAIEKELKSKAPIEPGTAIAAGPGSLTCANVIFAACLGPSEGAGKGKTGGGAGGKGPGNEAATITSALSRALRIAEELSLETLAIPGMAPDGAPKPGEMAAAVIAAIKGHEAESLSKIVLADEDEETVEAYIEALERFDEEEG